MCLFSLTKESHHLEKLMFSFCHESSHKYDSTSGQPPEAALREKKKMFQLVAMGALVFYLTLARAGPCHKMEANR